MAERLRLLVVEDERDTADMLIAYFEAQGYEVMSAAWGQDGVRIAQEKLPDLVLLDIRLPDIDGFEVCRQLRSNRRTESVPIIFLTEKRERIDKLFGLDLGAVDYITKPFDIQELRLRVRNVLRRAAYETLTDPVTNLPSEPLVNERLAVLLQQQRGWAVLCAGVHGLDKFGDVYGFVARDDALRALALILNNVAHEVADSPTTFVGQVSSSVFFIISEASRAAELRERLASRLRQAIPYFYPLRDARTTQAPIKLALSVVSEQDGPFADGEAVKVAALNALRPL